LKKIPFSSGFLNQTEIYQRRLPARPQITRIPADSNRSDFIHDYIIYPGLMAGLPGCDYQFAMRICFRRSEYPLKVTLIAHDHNSGAGWFNNAEIYNAVLSERIPRHHLPLSIIEKFDQAGIAPTSQDAACSIEKRGSLLIVMPGIAVERFGCHPYLSSFLT